MAVINWIIFILLFNYSLGAPPGNPPSFFGRPPSDQQRSFGRMSRPSSSGIDPGPQMGRSRTRPSVGALQPPPQEQEIGGQLDPNGEPGSFPDSPGLEGRQPQSGRAIPPGFNPRGPENVPFNAEDGMFERQRGGMPQRPMNGRQGPILPVRPPNAPPLLPPMSNNVEESIPPPPSEDGPDQEFNPNGPDSNDDQNNPLDRGFSSNVADQNRPEPQNRGFGSNGPDQSDPDPRSRGGPPMGPNDQNDPNQGGRNPIFPVRPPTRGNSAPVRPNANEANGQNWNISDAQAAGLINGEDLNASQEGRCVVCGPRNNFPIDPIAAQTARPGQMPEASYEDETEAPQRGGPNRPPDGPETSPKELFPSPEDLRLGDLAELAVNSLIRTCRTKLDCKEEPSGARQKRNDIHRIELEMLRKYKPFESPNVVERRLDKIHMVKRLMLNAAGLADQVRPTNDGTFQQDVLLTEDQAEYLLHKLRIPIHGSRTKRQAIYMEQMPAQIWEFGKPIPYTFDSSMNPRDRRIIQVALRTIETSTCIRFVEYPTKPPINHIYYVKISTPTFCGLSYIGKISPANPIYLSFACGDVVGVVIHETMHALGVAHEHLRVDRDKYVQLQWENINPQFFDYFAIGDPLAFTSYGVPFDFDSIMMYGPFTGAVDPSRPTIQPVDNDGSKFTKMGQRKRLSRADIMLLNRMYCRPPTCVDHNVFCGTWALRGLCVGAPQSSWMQRHCRRSCSLC